MQKHQHKPAKSEDRGRTHCITPRQCAAYPLLQASHGGIVRIETCSCGAIRMSEINRAAAAISDY